MRTITRTYVIYHYDELSDKAKEKVKAWYLNDDSRTIEFEDEYTENLRYLFKNSRLSLQFSLAYCQGDGLNIYGELDLEDVFTVISDRSFCGEYFKNYWDALTDHEIKTLRFYMDVCGKYIKLPRNNGYYSFCIADRTEFAEDWIEELIFGRYRGIQTDIIYKLENLVISIFSFLAKKYEEYGYKYIYDVDEDEISEVCESTGWEFFEDGRYFAE